jgi:hypothetical protein
MISSDHLTWKIIMNVQKKKKKKRIIYLITPFIQLHGILEAHMKTPFHLVVGKDMIHNIALRENQDQIQIQIPYEYKLGYQGLFGTPKILRTLSAPCTEPYAITNVYKNGIIRIQKGIILSRVNIRRITPFNKDPN